MKNYFYEFEPGAFIFISPNFNKILFIYKQGDIAVWLTAEETLEVINGIRKKKYLNKP